MKRVAFHTLGCKLNFAETSTLKRQFREQEFKIVDFRDQADIYIINTCSVTRDANRDCHKTVRRALRTNPEAYVAVVGCYAQLEPDEIAAIDGVDLVVGARDKFDVFELIQQVEKRDDTIVYRSDVNEAAEFHHAFSSDDRTRAFLKVQDGCDYKCAFCTIPLARGQSRSPRIREILDKARHVIDEGYREIVLTGVNVGLFGRQHGESLLGLIQELDRLSGLERLRFSSIEPNLLSEDIIRFAAESRTIQPHFHMPLQSGCDEMLRLMRRRYLSDLYRDRVKLIKEYMPHACIGVDVITGHPGETQERFQAGMDFVDSLETSYLHVFTYSERPNTKAMEIEPSVPMPERRRRTHQLRRLSDKKRYVFDNRYSGTHRPVLFEHAGKDGMMFGWTDNYIRVGVPWMPEYANRVLSCELGERRTDGYTEARVLQDACDKVDA